MLSEVAHVCAVTALPAVNPMAQLTIDLPPHVSADEARLLLSMKLFEAKRVSLGKAAELAGYSKRAFMELLAEQGIPVIDYSAGDLQREMEA